MSDSYVLPTVHWLRMAQCGTLNYVTDREATKLGHLGFWEMELISTTQVPSYVAHGGFNVDREGVFRSRLTEKGARLLAFLEADG